MTVTVSVITDDLSQNIHSVTVDDGEKVNAYGVTKTGSRWADWAETKSAQTAYESLPNILSRNIFDASSKSLEIVESLVPADIFEQVVKVLPGDVIVGDGPRHETMGRRYVARHVATKTLNSVPATATRPLHTFSAEQRRAVVQYKVNRFYTQQKYSTLNLEVKKVRAIFDTNIGPGGGWRCPDGSMYGGRITDRFGRGCGGGLTRRIGQAIMRAGRRIDDIGQARDTRRAARRAQRQVNRARRTDRRATRRGRASNALERLSQRLIGDYVPADRRSGRAARGGMDAETGQARRRPTPAPDVVPSGAPARPQGGRRRRRNVPDGGTQPRRENRTGRQRRVFDEATGNVIDPDTGEILERPERPRRPRTVQGTSPDLGRDRDGARSERDSSPRTIDEIDARLAEIDRELEEDARRYENNPVIDGRLNRRRLEDEKRQLEVRRMGLEAGFVDPDSRDGGGRPRPDGDRRPAPRPDGGGRRPRPDGDRRPAPRPDGEGRRPRPDGDRRPAPRPDAPTPARPTREQTGERPDQRLPLRARVSNAIERAVQRLIGNYVPADRRSGREARGGLPVDRERRNRRAQLSNALERWAQQLLRRRDGRSRERRREDNRRRRRRDERTITDEEMTNRLERELREELNLPADRDPDAAPEDARRDDEIREDVEEFVETISAERDAPDVEDADVPTPEADEGASVDDEFPPRIDREAMRQRIADDLNAKLDRASDDEFALSEFIDETEKERERFLNILRANQGDDAENDPRIREYDLAIADARERRDEMETDGVLQDLRDDELVREAEQRRRNGEPPTREQQEAVERQRVRAEQEARRRATEDAQDRDDSDRTPELSSADEDEARRLLDDEADEELIREAEARRDNGEPPTRAQQEAIDRQRNNARRQAERDVERRDRDAALVEEARQARESGEPPTREQQDAIDRERVRVQKEMDDSDTSLRERRLEPVAEKEFGKADTEELESLIDEIDKTDFDELSSLQKSRALFNRKRAQRELDLRAGRDGVDLNPVSRRDMTNVRNRYPRRGLPRRAFWRDDKAMSRSERDGYERRFGQYYYDDEGNLNARGLRVNRELGRERAERMEAGPSRRETTPLASRSDRDVTDPDGVVRPAVPGDIDPDAALGEFGNDVDDFAQHYAQYVAGLDDSPRNRAIKDSWLGVDEEIRQNYDDPAAMRELLSRYDDEIAERRGQAGYLDDDVAVNEVTARNFAKQRLEKRIKQLEDENTAAGFDPDDDFPTRRAAQDLDDLVTDGYNQRSLDQVDRRLAQLMRSEQGREIIRTTLADRNERMLNALRGTDDNPDALNNADEFYSLFAEAVERSNDGDLAELFYQSLTDVFGRTSIGENLYSGAERTGRISPPGRLRVLQQYSDARKTIDQRIALGRQLPGQIAALADLKNQMFDPPDGDGYARLVQEQMVDALLNITIPEEVVRDRGVGRAFVVGILNFERDHGGFGNVVSQMIEDINQGDELSPPAAFGDLLSRMLNEMNDARTRGDGNVADEIQEELDNLGAAFAMRLRRQSGSDYPPDFRAEDFKGFNSAVRNAEAWKDFGLPPFDGLELRNLDDADIAERFEIAERLANQELRNAFLGNAGIESPIERALAGQHIWRNHEDMSIMDDYRRSLAEEMNRRGMRLFAAQEEADRILREARERAAGINDPLAGGPARRMRELVDAAFERRREQLGRIDGFDPANPPWENAAVDHQILTPDALEVALAQGIDSGDNRTAIERGVRAMFEIEYTAPDGTKMRTRAAADVDQGFVREQVGPGYVGDGWLREYNEQMLTAFVIEAQNSKGEWTPVGHTIRLFKGDATDYMDPKGIESKFLVIEDIDLETGDRLSRSGGYFIDADGVFRNVAADFYLRGSDRDDALPELERRGLLTQENHGKTVTLENGDRVVITGTPRGGRNEMGWSIRQAAREDVKVLRDSGFGTAYNYHWFNYANALGYERITVEAGLEDGGYVWGRFGYRPPDREGIRLLNRNVQDALRAYDRDPASGVIKTDEQRDLLRYLSEQMEVNQFDPRLSPAHMEVIMALEAGEGSSSRRKEVRDFMKPNNLVVAELRFDDPSRGFIHTKPSNTRDVMDARFGTPAQRDPMMGRIFEDRTSTSGMARPRRIENAKIQTKRAAVDHVRNGGSLEEVPNEFWLDAVKSNASDKENDPNTAFFIMVQSSDQTGNMSKTYIFRRRNADGTPGNQGYVFKESKGNPVLNGGWDEPAADVIGYNLAHALGIMPEGAGWDGQGRGGTQIAVIPFAGGMLPDGVKDIRDYQGSQGVDPIDGEVRTLNYDVDVLDRQPQRALPQRLGHFLHNYLMGAFDKHPLNGMALEGDDGKVVIAPIDHGRMAIDHILDQLNPADRAMVERDFAVQLPNFPGVVGALGADADMRKYGDSAFWLDPGFMDKIKDYYDSVPAVDQRNFRQEMLAVYDDLMERARRVVAEGDQAFIDQIQFAIDAGGPPPAGFSTWDDYIARVRSYHSHMASKVSMADTNRDILLESLGGQ